MHKTKGQRAQRRPWHDILWVVPPPEAHRQASLALLSRSVALGMEDTPWTPTGRSHLEVTCHLPALPFHGDKFPSTAECFPKDGYQSSLEENFDNSGRYLSLLGLWALELNWGKWVLVTFSLFNVKKQTKKPNPPLETFGHGEGREMV